MDSIPKEPKSVKKVVNIKYPIESLSRLDKAVKLRPNSDRTKYILEAVNLAVENDLLDRSHFFLNDDDFENFNKLLDSPARSIAKLKALFKEKAPWEK